MDLAVTTSPDNDPRPRPAPAPAPRLTTKRRQKDDKKETLSCPLSWSLHRTTRATPHPRLSLDHASIHKPARCRFGDSGGDDRFHEGYGSNGPSAHPDLYDDTEVAGMAATTTAAIQPTDGLRTSRLVDPQHGPACAASTRRPDARLFPHRHSRWMRITQNGWISCVAQTPSSSAWQSCWYH